MTPSQSQWIGLVCRRATPFDLNMEWIMIGKIKDFKDTHNFYQPAAASTSTPPTLPMDFIDAFREVAEQLRSTQVVKSEESSSVVQEFPEGMSGFLFGNVAGLDVPQTADEDGLSISTRLSASKRTSSSLGSHKSKKGKYRKIYPVLDFKNLNGKRITTGRLFYLCSSLGKVRKVLLKKSKSEALVMMEKDKPAYEVIATFHGKTVWGTTLDVGLSKTEVLVKSEEARVVDYTNMTYEEFSSDSSDEEFDP